MNINKIRLIKQSLLEKYGQHIMDLVDYEIGDLVWNKTFEFTESKYKLKKVLLERGFLKTAKGDYDFVKYVDDSVRIHVVEKGSKGKIFYHLDKH